MRESGGLRINAVPCVGACNGRQRRAAVIALGDNLRLLFRSPTPPLQLFPGPPGAALARPKQPFFRMRQQRNTSECGSNCNASLVRPFVRSPALPRIRIPDLSTDFNALKRTTDSSAEAISAY
jgi:hypothetical protein